MGFHDKTRLKSENKKMELVLSLDRVNVSLSFSEKIGFSTTTVSKVTLFQYRI